MKVPSFFKGLNHRFAIGQMGQHSQLELPVIGHDKFLTFFCNESLSNFVFVLVERRLILQIWLLAGQSPGFGIYV
jgi:hypothetical protein